jgi:hypothetical protein
VHGSNQGGSVLDREELLMLAASQAASQGCVQSPHVCAHVCTVCA